MPTHKLVAAGATITCMHGGQVVLPGPPRLGMLLPNPVPLAVADILGAPIVGCPVAPSASTKPCLQTVSLTQGAGPPWLQLDNQVLLLDRAEGMTDGVPSATWRVTQPGQPFIHVDTEM